MFCKTCNILCYVACHVFLMCHELESAPIKHSKLLCFEFSLLECPLLGFYVEVHKQGY